MPGRKATVRRTEEEKKQIRNEIFVQRIPRKEVKAKWGLTTNQLYRITLGPSGES